MGAKLHWAKNEIRIWRAIWKVSLGVYNYNVIRPTGIQTINMGAHGESQVLFQSDDGFFYLRAKFSGFIEKVL
jgi:hypothetical protein